MVGQVQLYEFDPLDVRVMLTLPFSRSDVLSAAMDSGLAISVIVIFFVLQYPKNGTIGLNTVQAWWGNTVFLKTADGKGLAYKPLPASGAFG